MVPLGQLTPQLQLSSQNGIAPMEHPASSVVPTLALASGETQDSPVHYLFYMNSLCESG